MPTKAQLAMYCDVEKRLRALFSYFTDLCACCFAQTLEAIKAGARVDPESACCCMVDNQVHDYWRTLEGAQMTVVGPSWKKQLDKADLDVGKVIRGPCPALSSKGCVLLRLRPPTCSTQVCAYIMSAMSDLGVAVKTPTPCQIEELIGAPSPLDFAFGVSGKGVSREDQDAFRSGIERMIETIRSAPAQDVAAALDKAKRLIVESHQVRKGRRRR